MGFFCEKGATVAVRGLEKAIETSALLTVVVRLLERSVETAATPWCLLALGIFLIHLGRSPKPATVRAFRSQRSLALRPSRAREAWLRRFDNELWVPKELLARRALGKQIRGTCTSLVVASTAWRGFLEVLD